LLVVDALNFRVARFAESGAWRGSFGAPGEGPGLFARPKSVAVGADGRVYVTDAQQDVVMVFSAEGGFLFSLGQGGTGPGELTLPAGVAIRGETLYVADAQNGRVQIYALLGDPS
jgi:DNA-binding beta-propeller fold protein YncE